MRFLLVLVVACQHAPPSAELLQLEELSPTQVDPGTTLTIRARGLPAGREGRLRLRGQFYRPAEAPRTIDVEIVARAVADTQAEADLDRATIARLGGRGTLRGEAMLSFEAVGGGEVRGRLPIELDVGPADVAALRVHARREQTAPAELGVVLADDPFQARVEEVLEGSLAAHAGVRPGDRLIALGGLRIRSGADLAPSPGAGELVVERPGVAGTLTLRLPDPAQTQGRSYWLLLSLPIAAFWLLGPAGRELRRATPRGACPRLRRWVGMTAAAAFGATLLGWRPIDVGVWLAVSLLLRAASWTPASPRFRAVGAELALWMSTMAICVSTGSTSTAAAWTDPAHSALARAPLLWGLIFTVVLALAGRRGPIADAHRALAATLVVALAAGGFGGGVPLVAAGVLVAAVAAWLPTNATRWALPSALVLLPLHVAASFALPPPRLYETLALSAVIAAVPLVVLAWPRRRVPRIHAYL